MGSLGLKVYDVLDTGEQALLGELDSLSDSTDESHWDGDSTAISSSVAGGVGAGWGSECNLSCWGVVLTLGERLTVDRHGSKSSTVGVALALGVGLEGCLGHGM